MQKCKNAKIQKYKKGSRKNDGGECTNYEHSIKRVLYIFFLLWQRQFFLKKVPIFLELGGIVIMETRAEHKFVMNIICWTKKCGQNWNRAEQTDKLDKCFSLPFLSLCLQISVSHLTLVRSWHAKKVANWENWWEMRNRKFFSWLKKEAALFLRWFLLLILCLIPS